MEQFPLIAAWVLTGAFSGATLVTYRNSFLRSALGEDLFQLTDFGEYVPSQLGTILFVVVCTLVGPIATLGFLLSVLYTRAGIVMFKLLCPNLWEEYLESLS